MRELKPCGTPAAYMRHMAHGEPVDEACRIAVLDYNKPKSRVRYRALAVLALEYPERFAEILEQEKAAEAQRAA